MNKKAIAFARFIRRYKYFVYFFVGIFGLGMVFFVSMIPQIQAKHPNLYNAGMGIGCSIIATAIVTVILLVLIPDENDEQTELESWGIVRIYGERSAVKLNLKQFPKNRLDIIAFGLRHFREENRSTDMIVQKLKKGLHIRILSLNPDSIYVRGQQKIENNDDIGKDIIELIKWVERISKAYESAKGEKRGSIELKLYNSVPLDFYCLADNDIYVGPYMPDISSGKVITYNFTANSKGGSYFSEFFDKIWSNESNVRTTDSYVSYFALKQKDGIESVMKYFCKLIQGRNLKPVIGVVAIFKDQMRKTFFSCNKTHLESHACYKIEEGLIGKLVQLNADCSSRKYFLFKDFENNLAFVKEHQSRNEFIKKVEDDSTWSRAGRDTVAILAVPLVRDEHLVGAFTFDFAELPLEYAENLEELRQLDNDKVLKGKTECVMKGLFTIAADCAEIVENFLGQETESEYKALYEREWIGYV